MKKVGIYVRLSDEDRNKRNETDESESIQNQKSMLLAYAMERGWDVYKIYCDEDYSGADKNRPEWNDLIADAESKKFDIVLCKSQSRFTRELEMVEKYIHDKFLEWNIRFVGIVDNADTENTGNKKARQINGLINEWYLEDLSDNIRRTLNHKKRNGEWMGSFAPYGYMRDPADKNHLIIDSVASEVVKDIFNMYLEGMGYGAITKKLNELGIPNPYTYKRNNGSNFKTNTAGVTSGIWTISTVYQLIRREVYTGTLVQGISENISYKNDKRRKHAPEDWIRVPNTHEPIIDPETWNAVQEKLKVRKREQKYTGTVHIFAGKIFCDCCKNSMIKMSYRLKYGQYNYFKCRTREHTDLLCDNVKNIRYDVLSNKVKDEINQLLDEFYEPNLIILTDSDNDSTKETALSEEHREVLKLIDKKRQQLDVIYKDKLENLISAEEYSRHRNDINREVEQHENRLGIIEKELEEVKGTRTKSTTKETLLKKYRHINELDRNVVEEFVEAIYIGRVENNQREIEIKWKF